MSASEQAVVYAALILADDGIDITVWNFFLILFKVKEKIDKMD
jgi:hypothetical protein